MRSRLLILQAALALLIGIAGCAYPISYELRAKAQRDLTYPTVARDPDFYKGKTVIWGGIVMVYRSQPNQTVLTVLETPLDCWGIPQDEVSGRGRFIARVPQYLSEEIVSAKKKVTLAGTIVSEETRSLDDLQVRYPVLQVKEFHFFPEPYYYPSERAVHDNRGYRLHYDEPSPFHGIH